MNCLIDFLSDSKQREFRRLAQVQSETYEEALDIYKNLFLSHFDLIRKFYIEGGYCENHNECIKLHESIKDINDREISEFFDKLKKIYIYWINAEVIKSLTSLEQLLNEYKMLDFRASDINKEIFFRGRISKDLLTKWEMFHIPFNKRYLITNQRYSLTGQPIIYLGKSVLDIVQELGLKKEEIEDLKVSSIEINDDLNIYDLRNDIYNDISMIDTFSLLGESNIELCTKSQFFKKILSSICSFERRKEHKDYSFCEEYVIPQILAQTLKNTQRYDGIIYFSTQKFEGITFSNAETNHGEKVKYRENVALFTNFCNDHPYDIKLYEKMNISYPVSINMVKDISIESIESICNKIELLKNQEATTKSEVIKTIFDREFKCISIEGKEYLETKIGKLHLYHLQCILNNILCVNKG